MLTVEAKQRPSADLAVFRRTHAGTRRQTAPPKQRPACEHELDAVGVHRAVRPLERTGEGRTHEPARVVRVRGGEWSGPEPDRFRPIAGEGDPSRVTAGEGDPPQAAAGEKDDPKISVKQAAKELTTTGSAEFKVQGASPTRRRTAGSSSTSSSPARRRTVTARTSRPTPPGRSTGRDGRCVTGRCTSVPPTARMLLTRSAQRTKVPRPGRW